MKTIIHADELPQDVAGAEELLARHSEHKMELDARRHNFLSFQSKGKKLIAASHYATLEVLSFCTLYTQLPTSPLFNYACMEYFATSMHEWLWHICLHDLLLTITYQIQDKMTYLDQGHKELLDLWETRNTEYDHHLDFLKFHHEAEQAEGWIALREAFLQNEDYGVRYGWPKCD